MKALESQVAVVTGAGRGAGEAIAFRLASMGAHVILVARSARQLNRVRDQIVQAGGVATAIPCDLTNTSAVAKLGTAVAEQHRRCDILVNNAAIGMDGKLLHETSPDEWDLDPPQ
jgi:3-oxoacyl-[acyl-carrier protein] reductase